MHAALAQSICADRLSSVMRSAGLAHRADEFVEVFHEMTASWGAAGPAELAKSDVSSDGSPMEFAITLDDDEPAVQFAIEAVVRDGDPRQPVYLARVLMALLVARYGASDTAWNAVADLFLPDDPATAHVAMYGAEIGRSGPVGFKVWFYLGVTGADRSVHLTEEALSRLGLKGAWTSVVAHMCRHDRLDCPILFSLDLSSERTARVKLYFRHHEADGAYLSHLMGHYPGFTPQRVLDFCAAVTGGTDSLAEQPPVSCLAFADASEQVKSATLYMPMWTYAPEDEVVRARVRQLLFDNGRSTRLYEHALHDVAGRRLDEGRGLHNYVAWRPGGRRAPVKVYLSPELRHINPAARYRQQR